MNEDERVEEALDQAIEIIQKAAPASPFIFVHVAGFNYSNSNRRYEGTPAQIETAIKNTMLHTAIVCANAMNAMLMQAAKTKPMVRNMMTSDEVLAVTLLEDVHDKLLSEMENKK